MTKQHGSGHFGEWIEDAFGLPAYRYTCDQTNDPKAVSPVCPTWRQPTDHSHQVGNDRLVAVASNYGYVQVRQDEGSPKFLNDYDPDNAKYAGGFGYLTDGQTVLSTFYPGRGETFERVFGMGYVQKTVRGSGYSADHVVFAPFGDDPLLISQVTLTNHRDAPADLRWIEYWDCQMYQFSNRSMMVAMARRDVTQAAGLRREFAGRFSHHFRKLAAGLVEEKRFQGRSLRAKIGWGILQIALATIARRLTNGPVRTPVSQAVLEDLIPPPTFLVSLDAPADGMATDARAFFGAGGVENPDGLGAPLSGDLSTTGPESAMFLERRLGLEPGESRTLYFAFGYQPQGYAVEELVSRYQNEPEQLWLRSSAAWKADRIQLSVPGEPWVDRELAWHNYYLRSNLTYDSFFQEHILSQGHVYQYVFGFQGAARDPLQHALPLTFSQPDIVKQIIRYTLKEVRPDGEMPYAIVGHGVVMPAPFRPSDQEMWLLWLASEYVLASRDRAFLDEQISTYPVYGPKARKERVGNVLARCYRHLVQVTGTGEHGLLRLSNGDWNDGVILGHVPPKHHKQVAVQAESVLNAAMASYVLDLYASMLAYSGDASLASDARQKAQAQREAVRAQWAGRWFRRAWLSSELGWVGDERLWLEPQPWAIIGGAATPEQRETLVQALDELVRQPSPIGAMLLDASIENMDVPPGDLTNGAVWPSINGTLIWALARADGDLAWDEWKKNSLAQHAQAYPEVWYGIWSGPDTYNSALSRHPGQTYFNSATPKGVSPEENIVSGINWTDFPVMNMHPHAWPLYDVAKLIGVEFTPEGVELRPTLPQDEFRFESPLLALEKTAQGYSGRYAPQQAGEWKMTLYLPEDEGERFSRVEVNGEERALVRTANGALQWVGTSAPGKPLQWAI